VASRSPEAGTDDVAICFFRRSATRHARSPNAKRRPDLHRSPSPRSSRSTSSVVRWTRSTTSVTCPSSRTSTTYVPQPNGARAFPASIAPTHRSLSRNRRRQGLALRVGKRTRAASASRTRAGDPDASEASPAPPATARTRLARHPTPSRPRPRAPPPDANCPRTRHPSVRRRCSVSVRERVRIFYAFFARAFSLH
jgi:hypothetical protein